ncbi:hypothetical protein [Wolbachia endosymbiont (group A) of Scambus nigricans]|uniref:hypothetical protein n=1 Tax=Wolbachia endosymbiont (group A) of Scambus nigricans TaxID=2954055 RepID=UPI00222EEA1D|nr:hypothetical protein [Wolbachia endosymbiont (group A) of Scambus nigricans]
MLAGSLVIALFTIIRTDRNMLLACYSHKHISYRIRTIIRKAIAAEIPRMNRGMTVRGGMDVGKPFLGQL